MINKTLAIIGLVAFLATSATAQTNTAPPDSSMLKQTLDSMSLAKISSISNWAVEPYLTYAPSLKSGHKYGAGVLVIYNINNYLGGAVGVDYLGQFSLLSANLTLKYPIKIGQFVSLPDSLTNLVVTPFALGGIGTPYGSSSGEAAAIWDLGSAVQFGRFLGGKFNVGVAYGAWEHAGDYSGNRYHAFAGWSKGF